MQRMYLNEGWKFTPVFREELLKKDCREEELTAVRLPHTVAETPFSYFDEAVYQMVSGYRRMLHVPAEWSGKRLLLTFEGAAHDSVVFCNGKVVGEHHCGYTAFTVDISEAVTFGEDNVIVVRLDSRESLDVPPFGLVIDYMTYGGIYRDVYLEVKEQTYLQDVFHYCEFDTGCMAKDGLTATEVTLLSRCEIAGYTKNRELKMRLSMKGPDGKNEILSELPVEELSAEKAEDDRIIHTINWKIELQKAVWLWDPEHPSLYKLMVSLYSSRGLLDEKETSFGFRKAVFQADGFYLNGEKRKLRGLNRHQSYPYVGYAMPKSMQELDADLLKQELGVNAVRTSHYPQSHYFLNRCDELGLLVFTEIPGWQYIGGKAWKEQAVRNTEDMVRQYRNHPSIILWGVRINESADDDSFYQRTNEAAKRLDPLRQTGGVRALKKSSLLEDVYTYNDFLHDGETKGCEPKRKVTSDRNKGYLISEYNGHMYPTKSFDAEQHRTEHALRHARVLNAVAKEEDIAGSFGWCMFDYNTHKDFGSGDRICYHGVMDMFRNPKQAAYVYASQQEEHPVLHLSSSMDIGEHPGCNRGKIWIYSNADSVQVYKNNRLIKEYGPKDSPFSNLPHGPIALDDYIGDAIEKGERFKPSHAKEIKAALNATAIYGLNKLPKHFYLTALKMMLLYHLTPTEITELYTKYVGDWGTEATSYRLEAKKDGRVVETLIKEPVREVLLSCVADHCELCEDTSYDVALVRIRAVDRNGNVLPFFQEPVQLRTEGTIAQIGPECISLKGGMGGTYVKTLGQEGEGRLFISSAQTKEQCITFHVKRMDRRVTE